MKKTEICLHCNDDYTPTRRGVQNFCSKSCKSRYWYLKQNFGKKEEKDKEENHVPKQISKDISDELAALNEKINKLVQDQLELF